MKLCRFKHETDEIHIGLVGRNVVFDLAPAGITRLLPLLEDDNPVHAVARLAAGKLPRAPLSSVTLLAPVEGQEVWAAGVTHLRSRAARMEESNFNASAYHRVYAAKRPEIFFKSLPDKVVGPGEAVGIRRDARWSVPEPELALVINSRGRIAGHTIGNDLSSRDIEGDNLLYLPQAKIYHRSCALGPWIHLGAPERQVRQWTIRIKITRRGRAVFAGETSVGKIKRGFAQLANYLFRCQKFPRGAILLTGTGIVPPDSFTLAAGDRIRIAIDPIGLLENVVVQGGL